MNDCNEWDSNAEELSEDCEFSRDDLLRLICKRSKQGMLGLFAGTGLTKAILGDTKADSWVNLLKYCSKKMGIAEGDSDYEHLFGSGESQSDFLDCPKIASEICRLVADDNEDMPQRKASSKLKEFVSLKVMQYGDPPINGSEWYKRFFDMMSFDWVLTTNYDSVIESLMPGSTLTLLPEEKFVKTRNLTPVCHLHGSVTDPQSIVITDEDYTRFFRAGNYWQSRLSFLAKEHVMLMVGYGLGDSDVISAIDWCGSVYKDRETKGYDCPIIQIHFERSKPKTDPYIRKYGGSDVYVLDVESLESFTDELEDAQGESKQRVAVVEKEISALNSYFAGFNGDNNRFKINSFITNRDERQEKLKIINTLDPEYGDKIWPSFLKFFKKELDKVHNFSREDNHFGGYDYWLQMIIDVLCIIDFRKLPPSFFHEICESFDEVMRWIDSGSGYSYGYSWDATGTWKREKSNIPVVAMTQLKLFCIANGLINSKGLL